MKEAQIMKHNLERFKELKNELERTKFSDHNFCLKFAQDNHKQMLELFNEDLLTPTFLDKRRSDIIKKFE